MPAGALLAGGILLGSAGWSMAGDRDLPREYAASATANDSASAGASTTETPAASSSQQGIPLSAAAPAPAPDPVVGVPVQLQLPSLGVTADVVGVTVADGVVDVPADPRTVGWWAGGGLPGDAAGSTVVVGHVDTYEDGPGALYRLGELPAGAPVSVVLASGATVSYTVSELRVRSKAHALPADLFDRAGPPRLVLISCGGEFDEATRSYDDNIIVVATPSG